MHTVLITAIGSVAGLAAKRSLEAAGIRVVGCDIYPRAWNVTATEVAEFFTAPLGADAQAYCDALLSEALARGIDAIIPLTDVEVDALSPRKGQFRAAGVTVCCPDATAAALCRNKLAMAESLAFAGLATVIPTYLPGALPEDAPCPLMLKPLRGRSSQGQRVVADRAELAQALALREDYIIQPYLPGDVYTVDCARDAHGGTVALVRRELLRTGNGLGTAVEICPGHPLAAVCEGILRHAGIVGVVNMEFIHREGEFYFLEVNPRFSGGVGFSVLAGYDFPLAMLRCHTGAPLAAMPPLHAMTLAQRYEMRVTHPQPQD